MGRLSRLSHPIKRQTFQEDRRLSQLSMWQWFDFFASLFGGSQCSHSGFATQTYCQPSASTLLFLYRCCHHFDRPTSTCRLDLLWNRVSDQRVQTPAIEYPPQNILHRHECCQGQVWDLCSCTCRGPFCSFQPQMNLNIACRGPVHPISWQNLGESSGRSPDWLWVLALEWFQCRYLEDWWWCWCCCWHWYRIQF